VDANPAGRHPSNIIGEVQPEHQKYFYAPRATRKEKGEYNNHPTVKPVSLMSYLIRIYAPVGTTVLDPFCGSGTTGIAALIENRKFVGIDMVAEYVIIANKRCERIL
jgi:site-specific DNA-methyltransferase (adenine-specific)